MSLHSQHINPVLKGFGWATVKSQLLLRDVVMIHAGAWRKNLLWDPMSIVIEQDVRM